MISKSRNSMDRIQSILTLCATDPHLYSVVALTPQPHIMFRYANRDMATHHYKSIQSHGNAVALVWSGYIVRSCGANPRLKSHTF